MSRTAMSVQQAPSNLPEKTYAVGIQVSGGVWLSGLTAASADPVTGVYEYRGDLVEQATATLNKIETFLKQGDFALNEITSISQYISPTAVGDLPRLAAYYAERFGDKLPQVNTIMVKRLLKSKALIEIESVVGKPLSTGIVKLPAIGGTDLEDARRNVASQLEERGFSWQDVRKMSEYMTDGAGLGSKADPALPVDPMQVVMPLAGSTGQGAEIHVVACREPLDPVLYASASGNPAVGGIAEQCEDIYLRLEKQLNAQGSGLEKVVKTTEFVTLDSLKDYKLTADIRRRMFSAPYPAATGVLCDALPAEGAQIAVEVIATR